MRIRHMVLVVLGVCLVSLVGVLLEMSSEEHVAFPTSAPTEVISPSALLPVSVKISRGVIGQVSTARGGQAATSATSHASAGFVGFRKTTRDLQRTSSAIATASPTRAAKPKKAVVKRMSSIGAPGETPARAGLAGGSGTASGVGEQQSTRAEP